MHTHFFEKVEMSFYSSVVAGLMTGFPVTGGHSLPALSACLLHACASPAFDFCSTQLCVASASIPCLVQGWWPALLQRVVHSEGWLRNHQHAPWAPQSLSAKASCCSHQWRTSSIISVSDQFVTSAVAVLMVPLLDAVHRGPRKKHK